MKEILSIALPLIFAQLAVIGNGLADVYFSNSDSVETAAIVSMASSLFVTVAATLIALIHGLSPIIAQQWGQKDLRGIAKSLKSGVLVSLVASGLFSFIIHYYSNWLMHVFDVPTELIAPVQNYLDIAIFSLPEIALVRLYFVLASAVDKQSTILQINLFALAVKIFTTWILINGKFGFHVLGANACAISLVVMFGTSMIASSLFLFSDDFIGIKKHFTTVQIEFASMKEMLKLGIPISVSQFSEIASLSVLMLIIAPLGTMYITTHQILTSITTFSFTFSYCIGLAAQVMIARSIGQEKPVLAIKYSKSGLSLSCLVSLILCSVYLFLKADILTIFVSDSRLLSLLTFIFPIFCVYLFFDAIQTTANSALRGFKIVVFPAITYTVLLWFIGIGGSLALSYDLISIPYLDRFSLGKADSTLSAIWGASAVSVFLTAFALICRLRFDIFFFKRRCTKK